MAVMYSTPVDPATRSGFAALVVATHLVLIYVVGISLGVVEVPPVIKDSELVFISMPTVVEESPPEVKPPMIKPEVELPVPMPVAAPPTASSPLAEPVEASQSAPVAIPTLPIEVASLSVTKRIDPTYPSASRRAGETGRVRLRVLVDESGRPLEVQVVQSSGFERLDEAAVTAIKRWLFAPARQGSGPVAAWTQVSVTFQLVD